MGENNFVVHLLVVIQNNKRRTVRVLKTVSGVVTSVAPCTVTKFLIYKTDNRTSNIHKNKAICLLLHVSAELRHLHCVYKPNLKLTAV
jgi:hypothetical protein